MSALLSAIILLALSAGSIILRKVYIDKPSIDFNSLTTHHALKTRSVKSTKREYTLAASLRLISLLCFSLFLMIAVNNISGLLLLICVFVTTYFLFIWLTHKKPDSFSVGLANLLSPLFIAILNKTRNQTKRLENYLLMRHEINNQIKPMEKKEIISLLIAQKDLHAGKTLGRDLEVAINSANLAIKSIEQEMQKLEDLQVLDSNEQIGPILIDELHRSGRKVFLVRNNEDGLVGFVNLADLTSLKKDGKIKSAVKYNLNYVKAEDNILEIVNQFNENGSIIYVVVDNANEPVGVIHLEDILNQLI